MRLLAAVTIFFFLLTANSVSSQDKTKTQNPQHDAGSQPPQQAPPTTTVEVNVGYPRETEDRQPTKQNAKKESAPFMSNFEWVISAVTTIYSIFSVFTFFAIKRQVKAAEGELAAQSPWIMVNIEYTPGMLTRVHGTTRERDQPEIKHTDFVLRYTFVNHGRTPALITEKRAALILIPGDTLPKKPDIGKTELLDDPVEPLAAAQVSEPKDKFLSVVGYQGLDDWLILYGVVKYMDVFGRNRETTFGYRITIGNALERLSGRYPAYNQNT